MEGIQIIGPHSGLLSVQAAARRRAENERQRLRATAGREIRRINAALAAGHSTCGVCRAPITTRTTVCPTCHTDCVSTRASQASQRRLCPIEYSGHLGPVLSVR